ncbi:MAG TPA: META domain-containing protein [Anaerolineales bacterium]|jgi:heat shock protein HslJ
MDKLIKLFHAIVILGFLLLFACTSSGNAQSLPGSTWKLVSYGPVSNQTPVIPGVDTTITFDRDGKLSGSVGCNGFGGDYKVSAGKITFGPVMRTMMACDGPVMQQEDTVMQVFSGTAAYELESGKLTITSADASLAVVLAQTGR